MTLRRRKPALPTKSAAEIEPKPVKWIWPGHLAAGNIHILDGFPDMGKSMLTVYMAAVISSGGCWPDGTRAEEGKVLICNSEDDLANTIVPRLKIAGADMDKIHLLDDLERDLDLASDLDKIRLEIFRKSAKLVIIDPLFAVMGKGINTNSDRDVRQVLKPIQKISNETGAAILFVRHLTKTGKGPAIYRGGGSVGIIAAARVGLMWLEHPHDKDLRALMVTKSNIGKKPSMSTVWAIEDGGRLEFVREEALDVDELLSEHGKSGRPPEKRKEAQDWLREVLADGSLPARKIREGAEAEGFSQRTLASAKSDVAESYKEGRAWYWRLKDQE
jgi:hypothetical protein